MSNYERDRIRKMAGMFKALADPNRLRIFLRLVNCCAPGTPCSTEVALGACVGKLGRNLGIAPSTVSHHIKRLHRSGLMEMERHGQRIECRISPEVLRLLGDFFRMRKGVRE